MATTEPIRDQSQLHALADYFLQKGEFRNYTSSVVYADVFSASASVTGSDGKAVPLLPHPHSPSTSPPANKIVINRFFIFYFSSQRLSYQSKNRPVGSDVTFF